MWDQEKQRTTPVQQVSSTQATQLFQSGTAPSTVFQGIGSSLPPQAVMTSAATANVIAQRGRREAQV
jgi:hypothetical protein